MMLVTELFINHHGKNLSLCRQGLRSNILKQLHNAVDLF
jgi:hypothetical protein